MNIEDLLAEAREARDQAYAPYSRFAVGAALQTRSGRVFRGCNVENLSFGLTICAERNALFSAVAAGEREFEAIGIVADSKEPVTPCGACPQVLAALAPSPAIHCANLQGDIFESNLRELLPRATEGILGT